MERYQISRSVFREAIRKLEMAGLVEQRKGRGGGLVAAEPNPKDIVAATVIYLGRSNFNYNKFDEARTAIEMAAARMTAKRINADEIANLKAMNTQCQAADGAAFLLTNMQLYEKICSLSGNSILSLYAEVIEESGFFNLMDKINYSKLFVHIQPIKQSIDQLVTAIANGDAEGSLAAMAEHRELVAKILDEPQLADAASS